MLGRSAMNWLVLSVFSLHVMLGCCFHHAHLSHASPDSAIFVEHFGGSNDHSSEVAYDHGDSCCNDPCHGTGVPEQECKEGTCTFNVLRDAELPASTWVTMFATAAPKNAACSHGRTTGRISFESPLGARSTLQACQLLQTWLL